MHEQRGSFNGIDTCNVTNIGRFDFCSKLLDENESISIGNRPDINSLLTKLVKEKKVTKALANSMRESSKFYCEGIDFDRLTSASTYVPLETAMCLQNEIVDKGTKVAWDNRGSDDNGNQLPTIRQTIRKTWPVAIYPLQKNDCYGAPFPAIPKFNTRSHNTSMLWVVSALMSRVESLWFSILKLDEFYQSQWHGWLLTYLSKTCFPHLSFRNEKKDPFKYSLVRKKVEHIFEKIQPSFHDNNFDEVFNMISNVHCIDSFLHFDENIEPEYHDIVLIGNQEQEFELDNNPIEIIDTLPETKSVDSTEYELRVIVKMSNMDDSNEWNGEVYSRHGNSHCNWWHFSWDNDLSTQVDVLPTFNLSDQDRVIAVYVKKRVIDFQTLNYEYLKYIGGQQHVFCKTHEIPLIYSCNRNKKCNCGRKETFTCAKLDCHTCICQRCVDQMDPISIHHIEMNDNGATENVDDEDDNSQLLEPIADPNSEEFDDNIDEEINDNELPFQNILERDPDLLERDDFDDFVTSGEPPDIEDNFTGENNVIPTTNAGEFAFEIEEDVPTDRVYVSGHVILNQNGTVLTRKKHQIKGSSIHKFFLQKICATNIGSSIPLLYPESMLFPSIFYHMSDDGAMSGAIPSYLLTEHINKYGFQSLPQHIRSRLSSCSFSTGTDPRYISFSYDTMTNLSVNHNDARIVLHRGLTVDDESDIGIGVRGKKSGDSAILESIDSKQMVKNLSSSEKYIGKFDMFITLTCNMKQHFGTKIVKEWIDSDQWQQYFPGFNELLDYERKELHTALIQAAGPLFLRIWEEVSKLFLDYMKNSKSSPYKNVMAIFARKEYQKDKGNVSHTHLMLKLNWDKLSAEEKEFINDLIRASVIDVVRVDEVDHLIEHGLMESVVDLEKIVEDASNILGHRCSPRCLMMVAPGVFRCRKLNNLEVSPDNTKHVFKPLPNDYSLECIERLIKIGIIEPIHVTPEGYEAPFKSSNEYFHPKRHIPPTNPTGDINMSPVDGYFFTACRSMQNVQWLTQCGGVNRYVVKYIGKIDEQNYVIICTDSQQNGKLVSKAYFLHNTKVSTTKINEDKVKEQNKKNFHVQGRAISQNEMLHVMFRYAEIYTDLNFIAVPTIPLELRAGTDKVKSQSLPDDGADAGVLSDIVRKDMINDEWRHHSDSERLILEDIKMSKISIDKITQFSIRPPELRYLIDQTGNYFRWFKIIPQQLKEDDLREELSDDLLSSSWIDGMQRIVKLRCKAIPELIDYINNKMKHHDKEATHIKPMIDLFNNINSLLHQSNNNESQDAISTSSHSDNEIQDATSTSSHSNNEIQDATSILSHSDNEIQDTTSILSHSDNEIQDAISTSSQYNNESQDVASTSSHSDNESQDDAMMKQINDFWIDEDTNNIHLPIPVFSYIKPTMGTQFLLHLLLSMGHFSTEIDLTLHENLRESFRYAKLIGPDDDEESLQTYSNNLLKRFIEEQLVYFPNSKRVIDSWIITAGELLDEVIVRNNIPISDMPPVQQTAIFADCKEEEEKYIDSMKTKLIKSAMSELKEDSVQSCNIPTEEHLFNASKENPVEWDAYNSFTQSENQPDDSFNEQRFAIQKCKETIDSYYNGIFHNNFVKSLCIRGFAGCGKSWTMQYILLYAMSKGLLCVPTAMMSRRSVFLGGKHIHVLFGIPTEPNLSPHRMAELAITKLLRDPKKLSLLRKLDILFVDEIGQLPSELLAVLDIILRRIRDTNIFFGGVVIIGTIDHTQLQPVRGRPFLTSSHAITCFRMVKLKTSVRAAGDPDFQRIQEIARMHYSKYVSNPDLITEFKTLLSNTCTFVPSWTSPEITPSTYRLYGKKFPAKEATRQFVDGVRRSINQSNLREKDADDVEKSRYSHGEWLSASEQTKSTLNQKLKEPGTLLFFKGATYEFTYNSDEEFSQGQMAILYDVPTQDQIDRNKKIKILAAPPGYQDFDEFDPDQPKQFYLDKGFKEVSIGIAPERTQSIGRDLQAQRKQYGLKHRVTSTIHAAMGDTLIRVAIEISRSNSSFQLWDCAQAIVTLSRTKIGKNLILVGDKNETIEALSVLIQMKSQWTDYMEEVLKLITLHPVVNSDNQDVVDDSNRNLFTLQSYPFRLCDVSLPQCNTGFVYMLFSIKRQTYSYIGETICIRQRLKQHNSGYGSTSTAPSYLRPFAVMAYICGFDGNKTLRCYVEQKWKERRDTLISNNINDPRQWARSGNDVIESINEDSFNIEKSDLRLVLLFRDT